MVQIGWRRSLLFRFNTADLAARAHWMVLHSFYVAMESEMEYVAVSLAVSMTF